MKRSLFTVLIIAALAASSLHAAPSSSPVVAQVIISTGQDSARSVVSDSTAAVPRGNDYSKYARNESSSSNLWKWMIALDVVVLLLILFAIMRIRKKKKK